MRICIVTVAGHGIGGMQDHTRTLAKGLAARGADVHVITTRHPDGLREEEVDGARWHYVDAAHHHPWLPRRDPAWLPASRRAFAALHRAGAFDVVHSESASAIGLVRAGIHRSVPLVAKFHGNGLALGRAAVARARAGDARVRIREAKGIVWLLAEWFQYGHWHRFRPCVWMVPSAEEFEDTRRSAFLQRSLGHVVPNGIDERVFRPRPAAAVRAELGLAPGPLFVSVSRLNVQKGVHLALRALAELPARSPPPRLVVVGEGEERQALEQLTARLGLDGRVVFAGAQPQARVAAYLAAADVFLFPTERAEAAPLTLPQAMASALPVVASDIGGVAEVVQRSGENGLLVPPGDVGALARAMRRLLEDEPLRRGLGESARSRVLAEYTLERMVERTLAVYDHAIARRSEGRRAPGQTGSKRKPR